jgi:thymidylate synthase (FAD)
MSKVLDKGEVVYIDHMGSDLMVVNAARVSFAKESSWDYTDSAFPSKSLSEKDQKLIAYLAKHKHWTPFAHPQITLRIKHKVGFVENEVSRRYVNNEPEFYDPRWRSKPTNGAKQGSEDFMDTDGQSASHIMYSQVLELALSTYNSLLKRGVAPEQARFVLPQGAYTEWYWTGSLASYARVYKQRTDPHAQWEVQEYAKAMGEIIAPLFPISWEVLTK